MIPDISLTTTQTAKVLGCELETLRRWDKEYTLPMPPKAAGQWRRFDRDSLFRVAVMTRLVDAGFSPTSACDCVADSLHTVQSNQLPPGYVLAVGNFRSEAGVLRGCKLTTFENIEGFPMIRFWEKVQVRDSSGVAGTVEGLSLGLPGSITLIDLNAVMSWLDSNVSGIQGEERSAE